MGFDTEHRHHSQAAGESLEHPYTRLQPEVVIAAVEASGYFSDARILALNSYENRVYQVGLEEQGPIIAKFYRPQRWSLEQIDEEHRFTQFLLDNDIPVVAPLVLDENAEYPTIGHFDGFDFALYPRQGGRAPELDNLEHLHQLGRFMGRIHALGRGFEFEHRLRLSTAQSRSNVDYLLEQDFIPADLEAAYRAICSELLDAIAACPPDSSDYAQITLHGDCHAGNVLWRDDCPHFVDFDDCLTGPAMQDLWMLLSGDTASRQLQLLDIVEGYEMFYDFNPAELRLIEPLRAMRVLHFNAWLARRWHDPAFPLAFPWFNSPRYWSEYILELKELLSGLQLPPLSMP